MDYMASLGYEVHAISLPGHGKTPLKKKHINLYSIENYIECMAQELAGISPPPALIGHSLGGLMTLKYLESHKLPGAVLMASLPLSGALPLILKLLRINPWLTLRAFLSRDIRIPNPEVAQKLFLSADTKINLEQFFAQLVPDSMKVGTEMAFLIRAQPRKITTPVFVIAGENDACFSAMSEERLAKALGAKFLLLPGQAHNIMLEPAWRDAADKIDRWITDELKLP